MQHFVLKTGKITSVNFSKNKNCTRPTGLCNLVILWKICRANLSQIDLAIMLSLILIRRLCCRLASSLQEFGTSFLHYEIMDRTDHLHFYFSNFTTECFVSVGKRIVGYYISLCLAEFWFLPYVTLVFFVSKKRRTREKQTNRRPPKTGIRPLISKVIRLIRNMFLHRKAKQNKWRP